MTGIFPFHQECEPILRYRHLLQRQAKFFAPESWGYGNRGPDFSCVLTMEAFEQDDFKDLLIPQFPLLERNEPFFLRSILQKIPHLQTVLCDAAFSEDSMREIGRACAQNGCTFRSTLDQSVPPMVEGEGLLPLQTPVITIAGMWQDTDKLEASLCLRDILLREGYNVAQIGSRAYCELFRFHSFPSFMFEDRSDCNKILQFNRFVHDIEREEQPDVILITVPGCINNYNDDFTNSFGLLAYDVMKAVKPDFLLLCTFFTPNADMLFSLLSETCLYRFGRRVDYFHMSRQYIDIAASREAHKVVLKRAQPEMVLEELQKNQGVYTMQIGHLQSQDSRERLRDVLFDKLVTTTPAL